MGLANRAGVIQLDQLQPRYHNLHHFPISTYQDHIEDTASNINPSHRGVGITKGTLPTQRTFP